MSIALVGPLARACEPAADDRALAPNPDLVQGSLKNGLMYFIKPRAQPDGAVYVELGIRCGSMHEREGVSGAAKLLARLPFAASRGFAPGEALRRLDGAGIEVDRRRAVAVDLDLTRVRLEWANNDDPTLALALSFLAEAAGGVVFDDRAIEKEKQLLLAEERGRVNIQQRLVASAFPRLAPGSLLARHPPEGRPGAVADVTRTELEALHRDWWRTGRMWLVVVGDVDPVALVDRIGEAFAGIPDRPGPPDPDAAVRPLEELTPLVLSDPDLSNTTAQWLAMQSVALPIVRESDFRAEVVEEMAAEVMQRRLTRATISGRLSVPFAAARSWTAFGSLRFFSASMFDDRAEWSDLVAQLAGEMARAREHGFSEAELADARVAVRAAAESAARSEPTLEPRPLADAIFGALRRGSTVISRAQRLELLARSLPTISSDEVNATFRAMSEPGGSAAIVILPECGKPPTERDVLEVARRALGAPAEPLPAWERPASIVEHDPAPGRVVELSLEPETGTMSGWLGNGVRVHHRTLDDRTGQVHVAVTLAGGSIEEDRSTKGLSDAAAGAFVLPAARSRSAVDLDSLRLGKDIQLQAFADEDALRLVMTADTAMLPEALRLLHLLLREPVIEAAAFEKWKWRQRSIAHALRADAGNRLFVLLYQSLHAPGDPRGEPLDDDTIAGLTRDAAQAWLERLIAAPMEVAIVGDIRREPALELAAAYLGSLPARERIGPSLFKAQRESQREENAAGGTVVVESAHGTGSACLVGLRASPAPESDDDLLLQIAADVWKTRVSRLLIEERQIASSVDALSEPSSAYPALGATFATAIVEKPNIEEAARAMREQLAELTRVPVPIEEWQQSRQAVAQRLRERERRSDQWALTICASTYHARPVGAFAAARRRAEALGPERLVKLLGGLDTPDARLSIITTPSERAP